MTDLASSLGLLLRFAPVERETRARQRSDVSCTKGEGFRRAEEVDPEFPPGKAKIVKFSCTAPAYTCRKKKHAPNTLPISVTNCCASLSTLSSDRGRAENRNAQPSTDSRFLIPCRGIDFLDSRSRSHDVHRYARHPRIVLCTTGAHLHLVNVSDFARMRKTKKQTSNVTVVHVRPPSRIAVNPFANLRYTYVFSSEENWYTRFGKRFGNVQRTGEWNALQESRVQYTCAFDRRARNGTTVYH